MFNFFSKFFKKDKEVEELFAGSYKTKIKTFYFDEEKIVCRNIDNIDITILYKDIVRIFIMFYDDFLPLPIWTVQTKDDAVDIPNDIPNTDKLFFEVFNEKLDGYTSDETQAEILQAMTCTGFGLFHIWQRHDAPKIFKSMDIVELYFDEEKIISTNIDDVNINIPYQDIISICITIDELFYPSPRWAVISKDDNIRIPHDLKNADKLFFEGLEGKLNGYNSHKAQQQKSKAMLYTKGEGFFDVWQCPDIEKNI